jgi:hypothetical protein
MQATMLPPWLLIAVGIGVGLNLVAHGLLLWGRRRDRKGIRRL